jgi:hypothetical protein
MIKKQTLRINNSKGGMSQDSFNRLSSLGFNLMSGEETCAKWSNVEENHVCMYVVG